ncbi:MAG TPA: hypothetical protein VE821_04455, partial [Pyrinomonadaceae bacterium]|nr:hypothetical protein [Pyrinomonadaceae bacterium]
NHTPNAFQNNPVEALGGIKIYPKRWWGFGAWYRIHLNQQSAGHFNPNDFNTQINQISGIFVPGRGVVIVPGTTRPATANGLPLGFVPSDDPHGFGFQLFAGHRNAREPIELPNHPPVVSLAASSATVTMPANCPAGQIPREGCTPSSASVQLTATATDPDGDTLLYTWSTTGGRVTGDGPNVAWDLSGAAPGTYTATVEVDDGCGCISYANTSVTVTACDCVPAPTPLPTPEATPVPTPEATPVPPTARKFDEYGNIKRNDEKARLDNFANELQANPGAQGYIIGYGGRTSRPGEGQARADRAKDYLVNSRGIEAGRLVTVDGGYNEEPTTELWIVPSGATPPTASPTLTPDQVKPARVRRTTRRGHRRGRDDEE